MISLLAFIAFSSLQILLVRNFYSNKNNDKGNFISDSNIVILSSLSSLNIKSAERIMMPSIRKIKSRRVRVIREEDSEFPDMFLEYSEYWLKLIPVTSAGIAE